jgi:hypothetical protein
MIDLTATDEWRKSSKSTPNGNDCVEIAVLERRS